MLLDMARTKRERPSQDAPLSQWTIGRQTVIQGDCLTEFQGWITSLWTWLLPLHHTTLALLIGAMTISVLTRLRGLAGFSSSPPIVDQRVGRKGLHYSRWRVTAAVAIRGGGCGGNWSLSCWIRSCSSGSGWV